MTSEPRPKLPGTGVNKRGLAVAIIVGSVFLFGLLAGLTGAQEPAHTPRVAVTSTPTLAARPSPSPSRRSPSPSKLPSFRYAGDRQCAISYRARGRAMSWTVVVTVAGQLITHAADKSGNIYRHVVHVTPGPSVFTANVPLTQVDDIGGVLYTARSSYGCSVAPYRPGRHARHESQPRRRARHKKPSPTPAAQPSTTSCYPLSDEGTCYEPGEFCRDSDHGVSGLAGDGERIVCEDNDGWRWEPV